MPNPFLVGRTILLTGEPAWGWSGGAPELGIPSCDADRGEDVEGWGLDHVVVLVPDLQVALSAFGDIGLAPRLRVVVQGRPAAFFRAGPVIEVLESPVRGAAIYGVALVTEEPLEVLALRWRAMGRDVADPQPAQQPGRRILTVRATEAGLAVISPDRQVPAGTAAQVPSTKYQVLLDPKEQLP